jgi:hypothetical protein
MDKIPQLRESSPKGKELDKGKEPDKGNTSHSNKKRMLDFFRPEQRQKVTSSSSWPTNKKSQISTSSQMLEANEPQITPFRGEGKSSPASALLQQIHSTQKTTQKTIEKEMRQRLTRITGNPDFLKAYPQRPEVVQMRHAISRKLQASQRGQWLDYYSAHNDLSATETTLAQEAKMMNTLESSVRAHKHIESLLNTNDRAIDDKTVRKSIHALNEEISHIQERQNKTITQWEKLKDEIEKCVGELKQHAPDLPLPELDKVLIFPKGEKAKGKDEQSDKTEKETKKNGEKNSPSDVSKKGDQPSSSDDHAGSAAKTTTHQTLEVSAKAKALHKSLENLISRARSLHEDLTSLNNQWDNFVEKRKDQMEQLKSSYDLQSKHFTEAISTITTGPDKGKSDIATAMKYANRLVALAAVAAGGGGLRLRM